MTIHLASFIRFCVLSAVLCLSGCRSEIHAVVEWAKGKELIVYRFVHPPDASITLAFRDGPAETTVLRDSTDRWPNLVEASVVDGDSVGVLVCSSFAPQVEFAFSLSRRTAIPFSDLIRDAIRSSLRRRYRLDPAALTAKFSGDPIVWACSDRSDATARFDQVVGSARRLARMPVD